MVGSELEKAKESDKLERDFEKGTARGLERAWRQEWKDAWKEGGSEEGPGICGKGVKRDFKEGGYFLKGSLSLWTGRLGVKRGTRGR